MSEQMMICEYAHTCDKSDRCIAHKHQESCLGFYCHDTRRGANCVPVPGPKPTVAGLMQAEQIEAYTKALSGLLGFLKECCPTCGKPR